MVGEAQVRNVVEAIGLANVPYVAVVTGLDEAGMVSNVQVRVEGEPTGLVALAAAKPLAAVDLTAIPSDATIAIAGRLDPDSLMETIRFLVGKINPRAAENLNAEIGKIEEDLGIRLRDDLLRPLGDTWSAYNSPSEGGFVLTGLTVVTRLRDPDRLAKTHAKLLATARGLLERQPEGRPKVRIVSFKFGVREVNYLDIPNFPIAPAWSVTDKELVLATFPQNVKAYLAHRSNFRSLAETKEVAAAVQSESPPMAIGYQNTRQLFAILYPIVEIGAKFATSEFAREGVKFDLTRHSLRPVDHQAPPAVRERSTADARGHRDCLTADASRRQHRGLGARGRGALTSSGAGCARRSAAGPVDQQPEADRSGDAHVCRHLQDVSTCLQG